MLGMNHLQRLRVFAAGRSQALAFRTIAPLALVLAAVQMPLCVVQAQPFAPSSLGHVLDTQSKRMRPIYGFPGAAFLGEPTGPEVDQLWLSPDGRWVVYAADGEGRLALITAPTEALEVFPMPKQVKWSGDSNSVLIEESLPIDGGAAEEPRMASLLRFDLVRGDNTSSPAHWRRAWSAKLSFSALRILAVHTRRQEFWFRALTPSEVPEEPAGPLSQPDQGSLYRFDMLADQSERIASPARYEALVYANPGPTPAQESILVADGGNSVILEFLRQGDSWTRQEHPVDIPEGTSLAGLYSLPDGLAVLWNSQESGVPAKLGNYRWQEGRLLASSANLTDLDTPRASFVPLSQPALLLLEQTTGSSGLSFAIYDAARDQVFFLPGPEPSPAMLPPGANVSGGRN